MSINQTLIRLGTSPDLSESTLVVLIGGSNLSQINPCHVVPGLYILLENSVDPDQLASVEAS